MIQQTLLDADTAVTVGRLTRGQTPEHREGEVPGDMAAVLVDAAVQVGALIDAVCCRIGDWVDFEHYHLHPGMSVGSGGDKATVVRLQLTENERGLRAGGYIEVRVMPQEKVVEADGGYYDAYRQPRPVIEGSLGWHELNPQSLGQVLIMMFDRIIRDYREDSWN